MTLNRLDDFENACSAYEKAIDMESDHLFELNYAITLTNAEDLEKAREHFTRFEELFSKLDSDAKSNDSEVLDMRQALSDTLGIPVDAFAAASPAAAPSVGAAAPSADP